MVEERNLSISEMIQLAERVEDWKPGWGRTYHGSVDGLHIEINQICSPRLFFNPTTYRGHIIVDSEGVEIGNHEDPPLNSVYLMAEAKYKAKQESKRLGGIQKAQRVLEEG